MINVKRRIVMKSGLLTFLFALLALLSLTDIGVAQTNYFFRTPASEINGFVLPAPSGPDGNYFINDNWFDPTLQNRFVPEYDFGNGEKAFIENGGTAFVNVVVPADQAAGQLVMGSTSGTSGTLEIQNGGTLGARKGLATNGNITVGSSAGIGTLRVLPGGTLTAEGSLAQGSNAANLAQIGALTGSTATLSVDTAVLPSKVRVFPNAAFNVTSGTNFAATSIYTSEITGNGLNGKIDIGGTATLGGSLVLNFNSYTPSVGHNWTVLEAGAFDGNFSSVTTNVALPSNQNFIVTRPSVGGGQLGYNVSVAEVLVLEVNRDTGAATIKHPGSTNILLDGYYVGSTVGSLSGAGWNSLDDQNILGGDWLETAASSTNIAELKPTNDATITGGNVANISLGSIYNAGAGPFGRENEDLAFVYRRSSDGAQFNGRVQYTGTTINTLSLQVDPAGSGNALLKNNTTSTVMIDGYDILSASGRLSTSGWSSFDDQNFEGANTWLELSNSANQLGEVNQNGFTTLAPGASLDLGPLYLGGTQDLQFSFLLAGQEVGTAGKVYYVPGVPGDYNNNGVVDAGDYVVWRKHAGQTSPTYSLPNDGGTSPGVVDLADYNYWRSRFGAASGSGSGSGSLSGGGVPEPATWTLGLAVCFGAALVRRR
jgi:hypothetical protein